MTSFIQITLLSVLAALRRLFQKVTGRVPVPVRVPVRRPISPLGKTLFLRVPFENVVAQTTARRRNGEFTL